MKAYRFVIALLVLAVLVLPQATPVQSAPRSAENRINLQAGDTVTINCPTRLIRYSGSRTEWGIACRFSPTTRKAKPTATASATLSVTQTPASDTTQPRMLTVALQPRDTVTISCPTRVLRQKSVVSRTSWILWCYSAPEALTTTPTANATTPAGETPTSTMAQSPSPAATQTSMPAATNTSAPTATLLPSATPTRGTGGSIQPYANAPACSTHDSNVWHGLWDYQRGCYYNHTHGDDPSLADKYFGPLGAYWNGTTISYPFNSGPTENALKHAGYKVSVRMPGYHPWPACGTNDNTDITGDHSDNCVIASRVEYHIVGSLMDLAHRYHSYWMEIYICKPPYRQPQDCGIMRTGGLLDYAQLQAPHYNARIVRPGGMIDFGNGIMMDAMADGPDLPSQSGEPYVFSIPYSTSEVQGYRNNPPRATLMQSTEATIDQWSSNDFDCEPRPAGDPCHNQYTHVMFQVGDSFTLVDTQNLNNVRWICYGEPDCEYNGSLIGMNEIAVRVLQDWQSNGGGFVTSNGYSDKWGNPRLDNTCTSVSADCVPFILDHAPVGVAASRSNNGCECDVWEYDLYFSGKPSGWIKFPN